MMSYAVVIINALRALARAVWRGGGDSSNRTLLHDTQGKLIGIGGRKRTAPGQLSGQGTKTSAPLQLSAGSYRIDYQFQVNTRLALVDETGDDETLVLGLGAGTKRLTIPESGQYRLLVEPSSERGRWTVTYQQTS